MTTNLAGLAPRALWEHFAAIAAIPRPSKHEERIVSWVRELAERRRFAVRSDDVGNLVLEIPATAGLERAQIVVLQTHLDMVCEKNKDIQHDFLRDPIRPWVDGEWVRATGTTLGADNGIGVAAALAVATDPAVLHGPLELLFTIDEETGLTGAQRLSGSLLRGRTLLNLDSEEDGVLFVGCAGGADTWLTLRPRRVAARAGARSMRLEVGGLRGGHSGLNIHENRGNALKLLARTLVAALEAGVPFELAGLAGGSKHNAIPREAEALLALDEAAAARLATVLARLLEGFRDELHGVDPGLTLELAPVEATAPVLAEEDRDRLLDLLLGLPHGLLALSSAIPGLVESSSNLAVVSEDDGRLRIVTSSRSSVGSSLQAILMSVRSLGRLAGAEIQGHDGYPGWKPNLDSKVLQVVRRVYREQWGAEPKVTAIHAGLECGLLGEKLPGLDMISFGPQIEGAHSPDEKVHVPSVERFYRALTRVLGELAAA